MTALALLALTSAAHADDIVFTAFTLSADDGVTLSYALSPASAEAVAEASRMGGYPTISVQVVAGGMDRTSHVELKEQVRTVQLASGSWPPGLIATVKLVAPVRDLDRLRLPQGSGTSLRVPVAGGVAGAQPLGMPSQQRTSGSRSAGGGQVTVGPAPAPSVNVDPAAVDPAALIAAAQRAAQAAADAQRIAEEQRRIAEEQRRIAEERARIRARIQAVFDDPTHPVNVACSAFQGGHFEDCVEIAALRDQGAAEVDVCAGLDEPAFRIQCFESLEERRYAAGDALAACVAVFGTGEPGLRCTNAVIESADDPTDDVRACGAAFQRADDRLSCIGRFRERGGDRSAVIGACAAAFEGEFARECLAVAAEARGETVTACDAGFPEPKAAIDCIVTLRSLAERGPVLVPVCAELFEAQKERLQCLDRARRDPDPARIGACADEVAKKRLRCVEGG